MNINNELNGRDKLSFFQELYENAKAKLGTLIEDLDKHFEQYKGSNQIDGINAQPASVVRNITYELIESQITSYIPTAKVNTRIVSDKNIKNAMAIEKLGSMTIDRLGVEALNDIDERYTYIYGGSIWLVEWDETKRTHNTVGDAKLTCISPRNFVPQPNIFNIQDMEYCFVTFTTTKENVMRQYGVSLEVAETAANEEGEDDDTTTLYVCYYKDEDGKICEYVWAGDTEILDIDDFYARKRRVCTKCGKKEGLCECDKPKYRLMSEDYEEIDHNIVIDGEIVIPAESDVIRDGQVVTEKITRPATSANGMPQLDIDQDGNVEPMMTTEEIPVKERTKIPFYRPSRFPIVIRKNTSQESSLFGQSDCEFIRPQQQAINKIESRILSKVLKAGVIPTVPEDYLGNISDGIYDRAIKLKPGQEGLYGRIDLQVGIQGDINEAERLYDHAKRILGISDSFQGQYDSSAASGVAKQLQINQASGRLESKRRMKNHAYAEIYEIIFQYYLAYADEPRPVSYKDAIGKLQNVEFNRFAFVERDEAGEYYYNDEYLFSADAASDVEQYRQYLWDSNLNLFRTGAFGDQSQIDARLTYWRQMERAHYPFAHDMVEEVEAQKENEIMALQNQINTMNTDIEQRKQYEEYLRGEAYNVGE